MRVCRCSAQVRDVTAGPVTWIGTLVSVNEDANNFSRQNANRIHLRDGARAGGQVTRVTLNPLELLGRRRCIVSGVCRNNKSDGIICSWGGDVDGGHNDSLRVAGERRDVRLKGGCGARAQSTDRKEDNEQHRFARGLQSGKVLLQTFGGGASGWVIQETSNWAAELQTAQDSARINAMSHGRAARPIATL